MRCFGAAVLVLAMLAGCEDTPRASAPDDAEARRPRVFAPPPGQVRPVPPHAIRARGVGPYVLGEPLKDVLSSLPYGPRVELLKLRGIVDYSLVRAEGGRVIVGVARPDGVSFVAVLDPEVARTESGLGVGSTDQELAEALGAPAGGPKLARDPRMRVFAKLPNVTFVMADGKVAAVVVAARAEDGAASGAGTGKTAPAPATPATPAQSGCPETVSAATAREAAGVTLATAPVSMRCTDGKVVAAVVEGHEVIAVGGPVAGKLKRSAKSAIPGLVFAALVDVAPGFPPEVAAVSSERRGNSRDTRVTLLKPTAGTLSVTTERTPYRLSETAWMAARLEDTDLMIEVAAEGDQIEVGGLYLHWQGGQVKTVAPLLRERFTVRARSRSEAASPAGTWPDPGTQGAEPASPAAVANDSTAAPDQDASTETAATD